MLFEGFGSIGVLGPSKYSGQQLGSAEGRGGYCYVSRESRSLLRHGLGRPSMIIGLALRDPPGNLSIKRLNWDKEHLPWMIVMPSSTLLCVFCIPIKREFDKAIAEGERALALNPGGAGVLVRYANSLTDAGRPEEAIPLFQKAIRLNPLGPAFYLICTALHSGLRGG